MPCVAQPASLRHPQCQQPGSPGAYLSSSTPLLCPHYPQLPEPARGANPLVPLPLPPADSPIPHRLRKRRALNPWGSFVFLAYLVAFGFYVYIRASKTLGLGGMIW